MFDIVSLLGEIVGNRSEKNSALAKDFEFLFARYFGSKNNRPQIRHARGTIDGSLLGSCTNPNLNFLLTICSSGKPQGPASQLSFNSQLHFRSIRQDADLALPLFIRGKKDANITINGLQSDLRTRSISSVNIKYHSFWIILCDKCNVCVSHCIAA